MALLLLQLSDVNTMIFCGYSMLATALQIILAIAFSGRLLMERAERRWRTLSITDTLTGVLNRRGLQENFEQLTGKAGAGERKIAALLFDLDHFKAINDRYGHQTGDVVLAEFARIGRRFIPRNGIFGRMGGEEFTAFISVADQPEAEAIAELIRAEFCRVPLLAGRSLVPATVSAGIALMPAETANWDRLVSAADRALYSAKRAGRNCAVAFSEATAAMVPETAPDPHAGDLVPTLDDQIYALRRMGTLSRL
jgi:diguanylate cyclase (GGDEF)-like protein